MREGWGDRLQCSLRPGSAAAWCLGVGMGLDGDKLLGKGISGGVPLAGGGSAGPDLRSQEDSGEE